MQLLIMNQEVLEKNIQEYWKIPCFLLMWDKTVSGMAMGVAAALDALKWPEILGCIAGDDTIMCAAKTADMALGAAEKLRSFVRLNK